MTQSPASKRAIAVPALSFSRSSPNPNPILLPGVELSANDSADNLHARSMQGISSRLHPALNAALSVKDLARRTSTSSIQSLKHTVKLAETENVEVPVGIEHVNTLTLPQKVFYLLDGIPEGLQKSNELDNWRQPAAFAAYIHIFVVVVSCILFCVDSFPDYEMKESAAPVVNHVIAAILTLELLIRLFTAPDKAAFLQSQWTWIDIISIVPYFVALIVEASVGLERSFVFTRLARMIRALRIIRLGRQSIAIRAFYRSIGKSTSGLGLLLFLFSILVVIGASMVYIAEQTISDFDDNLNAWIYKSDGTVNPFSSVIHTSWFIVVSITTVGYGDMVVRSGLGKAVTACILLLGPFVIAFPTVILSANFADSHAALKGGLTKTVDTCEEKLKLERKRQQLLRSVEYYPFAKPAMEYSIAPGAPSRAICIKDHVALYDPLLLIRCRKEVGEHEYGFQSTSSAHVKVRDNYPHGVIVRFFLLLHTELVQNAATAAVKDYLRDFPKTRIDCVAPRPIRSLRATFASKHHALLQARVVCSKYVNPFGTISLDLMCRTEAVPVLLRFSSTCSFTFDVEFHDSAFSETLSLDAFRVADLSNQDQHSFCAFGHSIWL
jgi:hypothetical protein